jgi:GTP-binding protein
MAKLPVVAIIGRPNTGKSTLFNRLIGKRMAIENPVAGTTRDHVAHRVTTDDVDFLLLDTGGMGGGTEDKDFEDDVHAQSLLALQAADAILFTVDGRTELLRSDHQIVELLRKKRRRHVPVILVVTKCDTPKLIAAAENEFHGLGVEDDMMLVSAAHGGGIAELRDKIAGYLRDLHFTKSTPVEAPTDTPRIAIVGKPNVGKSSLINALMPDPQRELSPRLVSDIPGTTRDPTDVIIRYEGREFIVVDTAGLRRQARVEEEIEELSALRAYQAMEEADVVLLAIDGREPVSQQDKRIANAVIERGRALIILVNKIDLMKGEEREEKMAETRGEFLFCKYAPIIPCSAKTRENITKIFDLATVAHANRLRRFSTKDLHDFLDDVAHKAPVGEMRKCKHITQATDPPPTFIVFVKNPKKVDISQLRYLENRFRERFGMEGVPIKWITKGPEAERRRASKKKREQR